MLGFKVPVNTTTVTISGNANTRALLKQIAKRVPAAAKKRAAR